MARSVLAPAILVAAAIVMRLFVADAFEVPSSSMKPALEPGDHLIVTRSSLPGRGDVVVFHDVEGRHFVKRIVGLPGESIDANGLRVSVNGTTLAETYATTGTPASRATHLVPSGHYFVMGDNRETSEDSRTFGVIPAGSIVGRARWIYWSRDAAEGIRWARILSAIR